ncbi:MAG: chemotaxis protein CheX [Phycisphaeraceae bacterium]|nr:MAG: chemotaxis protein CheX [Phycisphaeraceae bacterium]
MQLLGVMPGVLLCVVLRTRSSHPADMAGAADRTCGPQISAAGRTDRRHRGANKAPDGKIVREVSIGSVERPEMAVSGVWERDHFWTSRQFHPRRAGWLGFLLMDAGRWRGQWVWGAMSGTESSRARRRTGKAGGNRVGLCALCALQRMRAALSILHEALARVSTEAASDCESWRETVWLVSGPSPDDPCRKSAVSQQFIQPVTEVIEHVFDVLLAMPVEVGARTLALAGDRDADLVGSVVLSGAITGVIAICLPMSTARRLVGLLKGHELGEDEEEALRDATGELVEMLAGGMKSRLSPTGTKMSCAEVVGGGDRIIQDDGQSRLVLPCMCECGAFSVEISCRLHAEPRAGAMSGSGSGA